MWSRFRKLHNPGVLLLIYSFGHMENAHAQAVNGDIPPAPVHSSTDERGVDLLSGAPQYQGPGMSIGPEGIGLSYSNTDGRSNYMYTIAYASGDDDAAHLIVSAGSDSASFKLIDSSYSSDRGDGATLIATSNGYTYTSRSGVVINFDKSYFSAQPTNYRGTYEAVATSVVYPSGNNLQFHYKLGSYSWSYGGNNVTVRAIRLQSVQNSAGYMLKFNYESDVESQSTWVAWNNYTSVNAIALTRNYCDPVANSCPSLDQAWPTLGFTWQIINGDFYSQNADPTSRVTRFGSDGRLLNVRMPASIADDLTYLYQNAYSPGDVTQVVVAGQGTWLYSYDYPSSYPVSLPANLQVRSITVKAPGAAVGKVYDVVWWSGVNVGLMPLHNRILRVTDENNRSLTLDYDSFNRITKETFPEGNFKSYTYDSRGNLLSVATTPKSGSGLSSTSVQVDYPANCSNPVTCNQPNWVKDANGKQTDFTYDPTHGGLTSEMKPAPTSGAARPLTLKSYAQRYAWIKNASGALVQSPDAIWLVASSTECQTAAASSTPTCDGSAPQVLTTYEYGANGTAESLLIKGLAVTSGGVTLRTCYSYDIYGNRVSETRPSASLGACP